MTFLTLWRKIYRKILQILRDIRRYYLFTFKPEYVIEQIKQRKGECTPNCGKCCTYVNCKYLDKKTKKCKIYKNRPQECRDFPIDRYDLMLAERIFGKWPQCGFYWGENEK